MTKLLPAKHVLNIKITKIFYSFFSYQVFKTYSIFNLQHLSVRPEMEWRAGKLSYSHGVWPSAPIPTHTECQGWPARGA